jgi:4-diphosphocytidyl-2-C-methyl-D-erythritol kinase
MRHVAPAKINLYLEVLGRREDGFHALETIFQTLALADFIDLEVDPGGAGIDLTCSDPSIPADASNLVWRAAAAVVARRPELGGIRLHLDKQIPHGAGLGGGSSDAATVLTVLNQHLTPPLSADTLAEIALQLGSDVPFFLLGGTAHATGRGEILTPLPALPPTPVTIVMPAAHLPTPQVFRALTASERGPRQPRGADWARSNCLHPASLLHNRLTAAAQRCCPAVSDLLT